MSLLLLKQKHKTEKLEGYAPKIAFYISKIESIQVEKETCK
jgi:hypothetical protein